MMDYQKHPPPHPAYAHDPRVVLAPPRPFGAPPPPSPPRRHQPQQLQPQQLQPQSPQPHLQPQSQPPPQTTYYDPFSNRREITAPRGYNPYTPSPSTSSSSASSSPSVLAATWTPSEPIYASYRTDRGGLVPAPVAVNHGSGRRKAQPGDGRRREKGHSRGSQSLSHGQSRYRTGGFFSSLVLS
ncbi:uncharacterized protein BDW47DRAFT_101636 [Aspergillus candidus]|uniref:Uncharacterized protein n=1 Tax=Aspergillus candidus TaxID=41067 RepID=A0A2I2FHX5_ASPCN|nr:hypothetical protein BDW47DRAFT_101636 [Aspergillus candidus]PLB40237.1 hypothetical protein BDW47DRAFT_101636 [Aspergillus candidus]